MTDSSGFFDQFLQKILIVVQCWNIYQHAFPQWKGQSDPPVFKSPKNVFSFSENVPVNCNRNGYPQDTIKIKAILIDEIFLFLISVLSFRLDYHGVVSIKQGVSLWVSYVRLVTEFLHREPLWKFFHNRFHFINKYILCNSCVVLYYHLSLFLNKR